MEAQPVTPTATKKIKGYNFMFLSPANVAHQTRYPVVWVGWLCSYFTFEDFGDHGLSGLEVIGMDINSDRLAKSKSAAFQALCVRHALEMPFIDSDIEPQPR